MNILDPIFFITRCSTIFASELPELIIISNPNALNNDFNTIYVNMGLKVLSFYSKCLIIYCNLLKVDNWYLLMFRQQSQLVHTTFTFSLPIAKVSITSLTQTHVPTYRFWVYVDDTSRFSYVCLSRVFICCKLYF
jgi:hypothetical protein